MESTAGLIERLTAAAEQLPVEKAQEVLDFAEYLLAREHVGPQLVVDGVLEIDPAKDPLLSFIGGISHGSLAKDIDIEIYGS